ncbi:MAG: flagellar biosynthesis anti-sigma factor FlgM [bacterium]|nr:flagellar biosynthesis anti-sigma factor FlgM [bacterium]
MNTRFMITLVTAVVSCVLLGGQNATAPKQPSAADISGMWRVDVPGMRKRPELRDALEDPKTRRLVDALATFTISFEPQPDGRVRVAVRPAGPSYLATATSGEGGRIVLRPPAGAGIVPTTIRPVDAEHIISEAVGNAPAMLYSRVFDPDGLVTGSWELDPESPGYDPIGLSIEVTTSGVAKITQGSVTWSGRLRRHETVDAGLPVTIYRLEGSTRAVKLEIRLGSKLNHATAAISEGNVGEQRWLIRRSITPEASLIGGWALDLPTLHAMEWVRRLPADERQQKIARIREQMGAFTIDARRIAEKKTTLKPMGSGKYGVYRAKELFAFVRILGLNRIVVEAGYGREYPFVRTTAAGSDGP